MFTLSNQPLDPNKLREGLATPESGAFASFEGIVRNHSEGKKVVALEYEAFPVMAQKEADKIFSEVRQKFDIIDLKCAHRIGKLNVGEMAVWVGVTAGHRDEAFKACRYMIDELKKRLPIWKKEFYENGDSGWVNCESCQIHVQGRSP